MGITINGSSAAGNIDLGTNGTRTDLAVGGLPDGTVDGDSVSTIPASKLTGALPAISGASLSGITTRTTPFRNIIINGAMQVAQRGTSSTTSGYATVDRFTTTWSGQDEAPTQEQASLTTSDTGPWAKGFRKALKITNGNQSSGAGAADSSQTLYKMEGQDLNHSGWDYADPNSKITLSFWAKSSVAQTFYIRLRGYATGGQMQYYAGFALAANTWTKVTKTIPGHASLADIPNNTSTGLFLVWQHYYGTDYTGTQTENAWHAKDTANNYPDMTTTWWTTNDATFMLTGVQLEAGDTATAFEHRSYGDELARCRRYYHHWVDSWDGTEATTGLMFQSYSSSGGHCPIHLVPQMRGVPTTKVSNSSNAWQYIDGGSSDDFDEIVGNSTSIWTNQCIELYAQGNLGTTSGHAAFVRCKSSPNTTYLAFDAEL